MLFVAAAAAGATAFVTAGVSLAAGPSGQSGSWSWTSVPAAKCQTEGGKERRPPLSAARFSNPSSHVPAVPYGSSDARCGFNWSQRWNFLKIVGVVLSC